MAVLSAVTRAADLGLRAHLHARGSPVPLVVEPEGRDRSAVALVCALQQHEPWVKQALREHGALLFRGFDLRTPEQFEQVARAVDPHLKNNYLGTSPRDALTSYVFSASELPPFYPIPQHCEMSFTRNPPRRLFFHCMIAPSGPGGETPLCDFRQVLRDLDPAVRAKFERLGVRNIRNYVGPEGGPRFDLWKLKRWDEMFQTTDRAKVEAICREQQFEVTWKSGGRLQLTNTQPAIHYHPETGDPIWFNHSQVFHLSCVPDEYRRIAARQRWVKNTGLRLFSAALVRAKRRLPVEDQAMHCTFGDGSPIPDADMDKVRDAVWKNLVAIPWQQGDVMAIDNFRVSHGRLPYEGPRKVTVCWA